MPKLLCLGIISYCLLRGVSLAQDHLGVDDYVTGMTVIGKPGAGPACPPIVWFVEPETPAAKAGIQPGDRPLSVDGKPVTDIVQARSLLRSSEPKSSTIELEGERGRYTLTVGRIANSVLYERRGWKRGPDGELYPVPNRCDVCRDAADQQNARRAQYQGVQHWSLSGESGTLLSGLRDFRLASAADYDGWRYRGRTSEGSRNTLR